VKAFSCWKRIWPAMAMAAAGLLAAAPAAGADRGKADIVLRVSQLGGGSGVPSINPRSAKERAERAVFDAFLAKHKDVAFDETRAIRLQGTAQESGTLLSMAGRTAGDVQYINPRAIDNFVREGFLVALDTYVLEHFRSEAAAQGIALPKDLTVGDIDAERAKYLTILQIKPEIWDVFYRPGVKRTATGKELYEIDRRKWHVWAWPFGQESMALFYRRDNLGKRRVEIAAALAEAARRRRRPEMLRADPARPPRTWEEMIVYSTALTDPVTREYGYTAYKGGWHFLATIWQAGGEVIARDAATGEWRLLWHCPGSLDAIRYWRELFNTTKAGRDAETGRRTTTQIAYVSGVGGADMSRDFKEGRVTFMYDYTTTGQFVLSGQPIDPALLGIAPLPAGPIQMTDPDVRLLEPAMLKGWDKLVAAELLERVVLPADRAKPTEREWGRVMPRDWATAKKFARVLGVRAYLDRAAEVEKTRARKDRPGWFAFAGGRTAPINALANFGDGWRIRANEVNASMYGITPFARERHPRQERAAWDFVAFRSSRESRRIETAAMVEAGMAVYINPARLREFGYEEYYADVPREWRETNEEVFATGRPEPNGKNCQQIYKALDFLAEAATTVGSDGLRRGLAANPLISASWRHGLGGRDGELLAALAAAGQDVSDAQRAELDGDNDRLKKPLDDSIERAKVDLLGVIDKAKVARLRKWVWLVVGIMGVGFPIALFMVLRSYRGRLGGPGLTSGAPVSARTHLTAWAFLALAVGTILLWSYVPLAWGSIMAFQDYRVMGGSTWAGLNNFIQVFADSLFWKAVVNTIIFVTLSLSMGFVLPIFLAIILDEIPKGKLLFRIIFYLPAVMSGVIVAFLWVWFYKGDADGLLNRIYLAMVPTMTTVIRALSPLHAVLGWSILAAVAGIVGCAIAANKIAASPRYRDRVDFTPRPVPGRLIVPLVFALLGLIVLYGVSGLSEPKDEPVKWIEQDPIVAMICVIIPGIWAGVGPGCIIYLAALKSIPEDVYEAADLDGAGPWRKIWTITLPYLKALIIINFVGAFIGAFKAWGQIFVMTGGGPNYGTHVLGLHVWYSAFAYLKFGYATAMAWVIGSAMIGFTVYQLRILRRMRFTTAKRD